MLRWCGLVWLGTFVVLLANDPGRMIFDTKLSVDLDPSGFYAGLWHLLNPLTDFGALNNQSVGYAVPMAPFYLAGHLAHVPVWLDRAAVAVADHRRRLRRPGQAGPRAPASAPRLRGCLAGLVFALWPTFTIVIGSTSSAALPGMLAAVGGPAAGRRGPRPGPRDLARRPVRRRGAVHVRGQRHRPPIDVLVLPALFILTYARGRRLSALALCWSAAVVVATAWWVLPLLLQGRYAFNFLPYIEQARRHHRAPCRPLPFAARRGKLDRLPQPRHARGCRRAGPS